MKDCLKKTDGLGEDFFKKESKTSWEGRSGQEDIRLGSKKKKTLNILMGRQKKKKDRAGLSWCISNNVGKGKVPTREGKRGSWSSSGEINVWGWKIAGHTPGMLRFRMRGEKRASEV